MAGPWGSGKSSVLNMIEEHISEHHGDTWSVARLTPWSATDVVALSGEFYNCIASPMPDTEPGKTAARKLRGMAPVRVTIGDCRSIESCCWTWTVAQPVGASRISWRLGERGEARLGLWSKGIGRRSAG